MLKVFTSLLRDRILEFLIKNHYIKTNFQKGFNPGLTGTYKYIGN